MRSKLSYILAVLILLIAGLHFTALYFSLYWYLWWYDFVTHFLGGVFAGLLSLWLLCLSGCLTPPRLTLRTFFLACFGGAILIGVGWEVFERVIGHTWSPEGYWLDTIIDILMDTLGGLVSFFFVSRFSKTDVSNAQEGI